MSLDGVGKLAEIKPQPAGRIKGDPNRILCTEAYRLNSKGVPMSGSEPTDCSSDLHYICGSTCITRRATKLSYRRRRRAGHKLRVDLQVRGWQRASLSVHRAGEDTRQRISCPSCRRMERRRSCFTLYSVDQVSGCIQKVLLVGLSDMFLSRKPDVRHKPSTAEMAEPVPRGRIDLCMRTLLSSVMALRSITPTQNFRSEFVIDREPKKRSVVITALTALSKGLSSLG